MANRPRRGPRPETRIPLLVDCDNTLGFSRQEIDDGLTLLMLLALDVGSDIGINAVKLVGVTTTFGNGPEDAVWAHTNDLLHRAGRPDIPVVRGARASGDFDTDAARFICRTAESYHGRLVVLSIGPVTNLAAAMQLDPALGDKIERVYLMGGYLRRLRFLRREVSELNLSSDPTSAALVLHSNCAITLMNAQLCLQSRYGLRDLLLELIRTPRLGRVIAEWFLVFGIHTGTMGFYLWDLVPAMAVVEPRRFRSRQVMLISTEADLAGGYLIFHESTGDSARAASVIDMPTRIRHRFRFSADCARLWRAVPLRVSPPS